MTILMPIQPSNIHQIGRIPKTSKSDLLYLSLGFTNAMYLLWTKVLAADSMKPNKSERYLETMHSELKK